MLDIIGRFVRRLFLILLLICIVIYLCIAYFYRDVFKLNTWINGVYCTGKTVEEVNSELLCETKAPFLTIMGENGETARIDLEEASFEADFTENLTNFVKGQNSLLWPVFLMQEQHIELEPAMSWDEEAVKALVLNQDIIKAELSSDTNVTIRLGENGYELQDNTKNVFHPEILAEYAVKNLQMGMYTVSVADSGAYQDLEYTAEQLYTLELWTKLQDFLNCGITYDMGAELIALDESITSKFVMTDEQGGIVLDENGEIVIREEGIVEFIEALAEEYNTCDTELAFEATRGETVWIPYKNYGTELNSEEEIAYLTTAFKIGVKETHTPSYKQEGYVKGKNDIGDTYIEVDMTKQKLYGYKDGELLIETDIVTGNMKRGWDTPVGVNRIYAKQKNRILRGATYASHVDYWMPVNGNIGIHDADWRKKFGEEIYLTNGSHGCINIPPKIMPTIYDNYEIGTPVIMFY